MSAAKHQLVIIGGGTGGISVAAKLRREQANLDITLIEPSEYHYYQPAWTLVGGGAYPAQATRRPFQDVLPKGVKHIAQTATELLPDSNQVKLANGDVIGYDYLVVAAGIQSNWSAIKGLEETLGKNGVTSNYHYQHAQYTWELVKNFKGGIAIFTQPVGAVKCPGAPQKALYLSADYWQDKGIKLDSLQFRSGGAGIFGVPFYAQALNQVIKAYQADTHYGQSLVEVRGAEKIAVFESSKDGEKIREEVAFDLLHVVPPQSAPSFIKNSPLANADGWLEVNQHSLRHTRYNNVFGLGDCTSSPNSKTCAAIKSQAPVLVKNLLSAIAKEETSAHYDGYAACPLTTSHGKVLLAEFTYGGVISTTLPLDSRIPRRFYWWLKRSFIPWFYWNLLLKGRNLPETHKARNFAAELSKPIEA
ncbi:MAG: hypothetical protein RL217_880 [Pseudomonadota bacterium]|jgi:sulfide:quinone oxidoreductase